MADGVCPKCNWRAPAGLLKCPFCKTYIRQPGSSSSTELKVPEPAREPARRDSGRQVAAVSKESSGILPALLQPDPSLPPPDPAIVKLVQRELARALFDDSNHEWPTEHSSKPKPEAKPEPKPLDDDEAAYPS